MIHLRILSLRLLAALIHVQYSLTRVRIFFSERRSLFLSGGRRVVDLFALLVFTVFALKGLRTVLNLVGLNG